MAVFTEEVTVGWRTVGVVLRKEVDGNDILNISNWVISRYGELSYYDLFSFQYPFCRNHLQASIFMIQPSLLYWT